MDIRDGLHGVTQFLHGLEETARTLPNKNFADIVASAKAKLAQAMEHPELDKVRDAYREREEAALGQNRFPGT